MSSPLGPGTAAGTAAASVATVAATASTAATADATEYVEAIMASKPIESSGDAPTPAPDVISTPVGRKRHLSLPDDVDLSTKKLRNDNSESGRIMADARRSLYGKTPTPKPKRKTHKDADTASTDQVGSAGPTDLSELHTPSVTEMLKCISTDIKGIHGRIKGLEHTLDSKHKALSERIDTLESRLEKRLSDKMAQIIDKRLTSEVNRMRKDVDGRLGDIRAEITSDLEEINKNIGALQETATTKDRSDVSLNIVIRDLPEHEGENLLLKVNNLFKDKLKLQSIEAHSVERKTSNSARPGIVIVTLETLQDKQKILKAKNLLRETNLNKVFIHPDQSHSERLLNSNIRAIVEAVNSGDRSINVRGGRVVTSRRASYRQPSGNDGNYRSNNNQHSEPRRETDVRSASRSDRGHRSSRARSSDVSNHQDTDRREYRSLFGNDRGGRGGDRGGYQGGNRGGYQSGARGSGSSSGGGARNRRGH